MNNKRLHYISDQIKESNVIDVGSDHGYLVRQLLDIKKVKHATIIEINQGPLENAQKNLAGYPGVDFLLSDGLCNYIGLCPNDTAVVIAGMGGKLIALIIGDSIDKLQETTLYLQPNNNEAELRKRLNNFGFKITSEEVICDNSIYYSVLIATKGDQILDDHQIAVGINVKRNNFYLHKLQEELIYLEELNKQIIVSGHENKDIMMRIKHLQIELGEL